MFPNNSPKLFDLHQRITQEDINKQDDGIGTSMEDLYLDKNPWNHYVPPLHPSENHTVLFKQPILKHNPPEPTKHPNNDFWDSDIYVNMPFYSGNMYEEIVDNDDVIKPRWELINSSLSRPINSANDLVAAISSYVPSILMPVYVKAGLSYFFEEILSEEESNYFFQTLLPQIIKLALQLPELVQSPIPILSENKAHSISLSQLQIASLLANAFLCTIPRSIQLDHGLPSINFQRLFTACIDDATADERLKCFLNYFYRIFIKEPVGVVTFERKYISQKNLPNWEKLNTTLKNSKIHVSCSGTIEDDGMGCLQVHFADKIIGGYILRKSGHIQEEIRFSINPELVVSRLFSETMDTNEALQITGVERFNVYTGYGRSFKWAGNFEDDTPFDCYGRRRTSIIAIDALPNPSEQHCPLRMLRELNKAYIGYHETMNVDNEFISPVATGKWGCGVFCGNVHLKTLLQIMACVAAGRDIVYFTFDDTLARDEIYDMHQFLVKKNITISKLWKYLCLFDEECIKNNRYSDLSLYQFIQKVHLKEIQPGSSWLRKLFLKL